MKNVQANFRGFMLFPLKLIEFICIDEIRKTVNGQEEKYLKNAIHNEILLNKISVHSLLQTNPLLMALIQFWKSHFETIQF